MTKRGHFIINGAPRVIVNQIIRAAGVYYQQQVNKVVHKGNKQVYRTFFVDIISQRGVWIRFELDKKRQIWVCMKKTPKIPIFIFLKALGFSKKTILADLKTAQVNTLNARKVNFRNFLFYITQNFQDEKNFTNSYIYRKFLNPEIYDLGITGRKRLNAKFGLQTHKTVLTPLDFLKIVYRLCEITKYQSMMDDIDNLSNRRIRTVGELLKIQFFQAMFRLEKILEPKMKKNESMETFFTTRAMNSALREFFGSCQLSQFLDQTNPLSELTHKRRISSLGPNGIQRETAGMEIRGIHSTYFGRICPIETPEGQNAGLVNSLTIFSKKNAEGFLESIFYKIYKGQIQTQLKPVSLNAIDEQNVRINFGDIRLSNFNFVKNRSITARYRQQLIRTSKSFVEFSYHSCFQMISIATALIPFLEHNDANRVLMGSNMQRQSVPLCLFESSKVRNIIENRVVSDCGYCSQISFSGLTLYSSKNQIHFYKFSSNWKIYRLEGCKSQTKNVAFFNKFWHKTHNYLRGRCFFLKIFKNRQKNGDLLALKNVSTTKFVRLTLKARMLRKLDWTKLAMKSQDFPKIQYNKRSASWRCFKTQTNIDRKFFSRGKLDLLNLRFTIGKIRFCHKTEHKLLPASLGLNLLTFSKIKNPAHTRYLNYSLQIKKNPIYEYKKVFQPVWQTPIDHQETLSHKQILWLKNYQKTNQGTHLIQKPLISSLEWVQKGDIVSDCSTSKNGKLALGQNLLIAYLPWEGFNFEDAIIINERCVSQDLYTSLHIEKYEVEIRDTINGLERITCNLPIHDPTRHQLDNNGIIQLGCFVQEGTILVGKVTPVENKPLLPHEKLLYDIVGKEIERVKDSSLRAPKSTFGRVIYISMNDRCYPENQYNTITSNKNQSPNPPNFQKICIYIAEKRKIKIGDKMAGRHGNKGIISKILPAQDLPFLLNGEILDLILNPLGVPSRMNVGQLFECLLGFAGEKLHQEFQLEIFDEKYGFDASRSLVYWKLFELRKKFHQKWFFSTQCPGKIPLFDGRTGEKYQQTSTVGRSYILKLIHLVDDKMHARSTGPYSLVTQQPLKGRSKHGGQRFGEMEVWALQGFGSAFILQELLTVKSDDTKGRSKVIENILKNSTMIFGTPESFKVLLRELQSLCLDVQICQKTL